MAIALDSATNNSGQTATGSATSLTVTTFTVGAGLTNSILVMRPGWVTLTSSTIHVSTSTKPTWNGSNLTQVASAEASKTGTFSKTVCDIWYILAPTSGNKNLVVTMSGSCLVIDNGCDSWQGVDQTTPVGTAVTGTAASSPASITLTTSNTDECVGVACGENNGATHDWLTSDTQSYRQDDQSQIGTNTTASYKAGASGTTALTWTTDSGGNVAMTGVPLHVASTFNPGWATGATKTTGGVF